MAEAYADAVQVPDERNTGGYVTVTYYGTERETATPPVVETVERLQERGYAAGDIAILVRRNSEATRIASMLLEHKRTHPESPYRYDVITQDALVIGRSPVVNFVISCLRLAGNPEDSIHRAIYNRFLGRGFGERLTRDDTEFLLRLRLMPPEEAFENTVMRYGLGCSDEDISSAGPPRTDNRFHEIERGGHSPFSVVVDRKRQYQIHPDALRGKRHHHRHHPPLQRARLQGRHHSLLQLVPDDQDRYRRVVGGGRGLPAGCRRTVPRTL
ncbi:MAG: hypothetical protein ACLUZZ_03705 [Alistipes inops]